jgi:hypothetical protein
LLNRHGFGIEEMAYLKHWTPGRVRRLLATLVRAPLPDRLALNTLLVVASPLDRGACAPSAGRTL